MSVLDRTCPYPLCDGSPGISGRTGVCDACKRPVFLCSDDDCGFVNRGVASRCRGCGVEVQYPVVPLASSATSPSFLGSRELEESFHGSPVVHAGRLWFLSSKGALVGITAGSHRIEEVEAVMNPSAASRRMAVASVAWGAHILPSAVIPLRSRVDAINLLTYEVRTLHQAEAEFATCGFSRTDSATIVAGAPGEVAFLIRNEDRYELVASFGGDQPVSVPLGDSPFCSGPIRLGSAFLAYTQDGIFRIAEGESDRIEIKDGCRLVQWFNDGAVRAATGALPYWAEPRHAYIPAERDGTPLLVHVSDSGFPEYSVVEGLPQQAVYSTSAQGSSWSRPGGVDVLRRGSFQSRIHDDQIAGDRPSWVEGGTSAYVLRGPHRGEQICVEGSAGRLTTQTAELADFEAMNQFVRVGNYLVLTYRTRAGRLGLASWIV